MASLTQGLRANQSRFFFKLQGYEPDSFKVMSFTSRGHELSGDYQFTLTLSSRDRIDPAQLADQPGRFILMWDKAPQTIHGCLSEATREGSSLNGFVYKVTFSSPLARLKLSRQCRVFLKKNVVEVVGEVLEGGGLEKEAFEFRLGRDYPAREYQVQYEESDYDFILRQLAHWGLFYYFEQDAEGARLILCDDVAKAPRLPGTGNLRFQVQTGEARLEESVYTLQPRAILITGDLLLKDYNYRTPANPLRVEQGSASEVAGCGSDYRYGENYKTQEEGEWIARIRMEALDWQRQTYLAESDCCGLAPGYRFTISRHPDPALNGDYLVVEVRHNADQSAGDAETGDTPGHHYSNQLQLIRAGVPYRHPVAEEQPVIGNFSARVESPGGDYAHLDEQGRYRVRLAFDLGDAPAGGASHAVRMMQPYAGNGYGFHFPLHAGTEVALSCANGDLDRPFISGALPNAETLSPVTEDNLTQNILRSWGENELLMEDRRGEERVELFTRDRQNILTLDAKADSHLVRLASEQGEMKIHAGKTMLLESGDSHTLESGNDHIVVVENHQRLMTKNKDIQLEAATDVLFTAQRDVQLEAQKQDIKARARRDFVVRAVRNASIEVKRENLTMQVNAGDFQLQAARAITLKGQGGGKIRIGQAAGTIEIDTGGEISISGPKVQISGETIAIKGSNVGNN